MKVSRRLGLPGLLFAAALALASCGGSGGGSGASTQASEQAAPETTGGGMSGMDMGGTTGGMQGMDDGSSSPEEMARRIVAPNGEYSDAAFVDSMIPHHEGAVEMAEVALDNAEHEEIRTLAQNIVDSQRAEIQLLGQMREELGGATTTSMSQEEMEGMMGMSEDPQALAEERPFDKAFMDAMTPHHESAIAMANVALEESEDPEIRRVAQDIVSAQEREISEMRRWREEWYPEG
ncbi:DUF305 domain-containing protein [Rubrobacter marinus]|uniref:DUF305 domain-containing protein n=1 Tax=Rubrobacter marinus TaxID=2653852 RepID=UPI00140A1FF8|nr:DUF305 domain-containing protein [Rubrobacter marinus]